MPVCHDFHYFFPGIITSAAMLLLLQAAALKAAPALQIAVLEGDGAINNVRSRSAHDVVVQVREEDGAPVPAASVVFQAPITGASISFINDQKTFITQTDTSGRAVAHGLHPNAVTGAYKVHITVAFKLETADTMITQTNASPAEAHSSKKLLLIGLAAGAVAGGVFAASHAGASSASTSSTSTGSIVPGTPAFGPPH